MPLPPPSAASPATYQHVLVLQEGMVTLINALATHAPGSIQTGSVDDLSPAGQEVVRPVATARTRPRRRDHVVPGTRLRPLIREVDPAVADDMPPSATLRQPP